MFKREYQGGSHVMVLSAQGRDPTAHCKVTGSVTHRYDKGIRGYVHVLEGDSITTKIQLPSNESSLALVQPYLVLQAAIPRDARCVVELCLQVNKGGRRRILFSSSVRKPSISPLIARVPLITMATGEWCNVCFDLSSLVMELFPGHTHKSLESLVVGGACQLRRVFTLRERPRDSDNCHEDLVSEDGTRDIPTACQLTIDHKAIPTKVMSSVSNDNQPSTTSVSTATAHSTEPHRPATDRPLTHLAFGKKVVIPAHVLAREQAKSSRSAGNVRKKSGVHSAPRQVSSPSSVRRKEGVAGVQGVGLEGRGQDKTRQVQKEGSERGREGRGGEGLKQDELLALDVLAIAPVSGSPVPSGMESRQKTSTPEGAGGGVKGRSSHLEYSSEGEEEEGVEDEGEDTEQMFSYFSPPRSAGTTHSPSGDSRHSARGVGFDRDFLTTTAADDAAVNEQGSPHRDRESDDEEGFPPDDVTMMSSSHCDVMHRDSGDNAETVDTGIPQKAPLKNDAMNDTRLSDDYDWRQYTSQEDTPPLPPSPQSPHSPPHTLTAHHGNTSTDPNTSTLSDTMATEKAAPHSLLDSLDTRSMGGALSPEVSDHSVNQFDSFLNQTNQSDEELELMYDPQLKCFFDPKTHKYYELAQ